MLIQIHCRFKTWAVFLLPLFSLPPLSPLLPSPSSSLLSAGQGWHDQCSWRDLDRGAFPFQKMVLKNKKGVGETTTPKPNSLRSSMAKDNKSKADLIHKLCLSYDFLPSQWVAVPVIRSVPEARDSEMNEYILRAFLLPLPAFENTHTPMCTQACNAHLQTQGHPFCAPRELSCHPQGLL